MPRATIVLLLATFAACEIAAETKAEGLPPVRQITHGPKFHWFGYYDKLEFDPTSRYVLANEVDFEGRSPTAADVIRVGMIDLADHDKWIELGESRAWSWQQGCMLQWRPGSKSEVLWNDREGDHYVCRILDVFTRRKRTIPTVIYALSPGGRQAVAADFRRVQDHRPGYGYAGLPDPCKGEAVPATSGVWSVDLETGESKLVVSIAQAAAIPYENGDPEEFKVSSHWFNHLLYNTDGTRLLFLHRWRPAAGSKYADKYRRVGGFGTRMFTANPDGTGLYVLDPCGKTSHFVWKDAHTVTAWAWHPSAGDRFYDFQDRSRDVSVVGRDVMAVNGHNTYLAQAGNAWILCDTYPDAQRLQNPYLYHIPTNRRIALGHFPSPRQYTGEWRCDTHPRGDPSGTKVVIDSPHNGGRQLYLIDVRDIVAPGNSTGRSRQGQQVGGE
jgi:hypothetical protein